MTSPFNEIRQRTAPLQSNCVAAEDEKKARLLLGRQKYPLLHSRLGQPDCAIARSAAAAESGDFPKQPQPSVLPLPAELWTLIGKLLALPRHRDDLSLCRAALDLGALACVSSGLKNVVASAIPDTALWRLHTEQAFSRVLEESIADDPFLQEPGSAQTLHRQEQGGRGKKWCDLSACDWSFATHPQGDRLNAAVDEICSGRAVIGLHVDLFDSPRWISILKRILEQADWTTLHLSLIGVQVGQKSYSEFRNIPKHARQALEYFWSSLCAPIAALNAQSRHVALTLSGTDAATDFNAAARTLPGFEQAFSALALQYFPPNSFALTALENVIAASPYLTHLDLTASIHNNADLKRLIQALYQHGKLQSLVLDELLTNEETFHQLGRYVRSHPELKSLSLKNSRDNSAAIATFLRKLARKPGDALLRLDLRGNKLKPGHIGTLSTWLKQASNGIPHAPVLEELYLANESNSAFLAEESCKKIQAILFQNPALKILDLNFFHISAYHTSALITALLFNRQLEVLHINQGHFDALGIGLLGKLIESRTTPLLLELSGADFDQSARLHIDRLRQLHPSVRIKWSSASADTGSLPPDRCKQD